MEIKNPNNLSCVHNNGRLIKTFTDVNECLEYADKIEKETGIKLQCDPLYNVLLRNYINGNIDGWRESNNKQPKYVTVGTAFN